MKPTPKHQVVEETQRRVDAGFLAKKYNVSSAYILQLARKKRIPCIRLGKNCVRFDEAAVAVALEGGEK